MAAASGDVHINALDYIVNKCNSTVHKTVQIKPIDVTSNSYAEYNVDSNESDSKFKVGDHVRISKYKILFAKGYTQNSSEEVLITSKIKNTVPWTNIISHLKGKEITESFYKNKL